MKVIDLLYLVATKYLPFHMVSGVKYIEVICKKDFRLNNSFEEKTNCKCTANVTSCQSPDSLQPFDETEIQGRNKTNVITMK